MKKISNKMLAAFLSIIMVLGSCNTAMFAKDNSRPADFVFQAHENDGGLLNGDAKANDLASDFSSFGGAFVPNDYIVFKDVDFGDGSYNTIMAVVSAISSDAGKTIAISIDGVSNKIGTISVKGCAKTSDFKENYGTISKVTGVHDVYLVFESSMNVNIDWFTFSSYNGAETEEERDERMKWWRDAHYGQFIHFGAYAYAGGVYKGQSVGYAEWIMNYLGIPKDEYAANIAKPFNPKEFDAEKIVSIAKDAGQEYIIFTSRHHEGFSMYDTKIRDFKDYSLMSYGDYTGPDPIKALAEECKKQDIKFGVYYTIFDWHDYTQSNYGNSIVADQKEDFKTRMKGQLRELVDDYDVEVLWFDGEWPGWWTKADGQEFYRFLRTMKPSIIVNNRVGKRDVDDGDFGTPEQEIPSGGLNYDWESCITLNNTWGYHKNDNSWKNANTVITSLVDIISKGGNYLLNVGPDELGNVPKPSADILKEAGVWLKANGDSIYGTRRSCFANLPSGVKATTKDGKVYLHILNFPQDNSIIIPKLENEILGMKVLGKDQNVSYTELKSKMVIDLAGIAKDKFDTVIEISVDGIPKSVDSDVNANIALKAKSVTGTNYYQNMSAYAPDKAIDGNADSRWATNGGTTAATLELTFAEPVTVNSAYIKQYTSSSNWTKAFTIDYWDGSKWVAGYTGGNIDAESNFNFSNITSDKIRLNLTNTSNPSIYEFQLFNKERIDVAITNPASGNIIGNAPFTISGTSEGGMAVALKISGVDFAPIEANVLVDEDGNWSYTVDSINAGSISIRAALLDMDNDIIAVATSSLIVRGYENFVYNKPVTVSSVYEQLPGYDAQKVVDGSKETRWAPKDGDLQPWMIVDLGGMVTFDRAILSEMYDTWTVPNQYRCLEFTIEYFDGESWQMAYEGTEIGEELTVDFPAVTGNQVRVSLLKSRATQTKAPANLVEFELYNISGVNENVISSVKAVPDSVSIGYDANIKVNVKTNNADGKEIKVALFGKEATVVNGVASFFFAASELPAVGEYFAVVTVVGSDETVQIKVTVSESDIQVIRPYILGMEEVGVKLKGIYYYYDSKNKNPESGSTFRWLRADEKSGEYEAIEGATGIEYTLTDEDAGKYIAFEVTPRSSGIVGKTERSFHIGPVLTVEQYESINNKLDKSKPFMNNISAIQGEIAAKMANAVYFTVDYELLSGSDYVYANNVKYAFSKDTKPIVKNGVAFAPAGFFTRYLAVSAPAVATITENGMTYYNLKAAVESLGKKYWDGSTTNSPVDSYLMSHKGEGLIVISNTANIFDPVKDRDLINEACNMLYTLRSTDEQMQWFRDSKFGFFIHWDPSSIRGVEISWDRRAFRPADIGSSYYNAIDPVYDTEYKKFNPTQYDPDEWMRIAKESGMKYVVLTTKHHGSFSNFFTDYDTYSIENTPYGQDIVKKYVEAARKAGLKVGFYYSPRDWYQPNYLTQDHHRYMEYYFGQIEELLSNYGKIDVMWFDSIGAESSGNYNVWDPRTMLRRMRQLQPDIIVNNRFVSYLGSYDRAPYDINGDWYTPEHRLGGFDSSRPWESCMTVTNAPGGGWSYRPDGVVNTVQESLKYLINNTINDGNLLYNIGPMSTGELHPDHAAVILSMGQWLNVYGEAVYNTRGGPYQNVNWGGSTYKVNENGTTTVYLHISPLIGGYTPTGNSIQIPAVPDGQEYTIATLLKNGKAVQMTKNDSGLLLTLPEGETWEAYDTVIKLEADMLTALNGAVAKAEALAQTISSDRLAQVKSALINEINASKDAIANGDTASYSARLLGLVNETKRSTAAIALNDMIIKAESALDTLQVGTKPWDCPQSLYDSLNNSITASVALLASSNATAPDFKAALKDISNNLEALNAIMQALTISFEPVKGVVTSGATFKLTSALADKLDMRYTFGAEPTAKSPLYKAPVAIPSGSTTVKAAMFDGDRKVGSTYESTFMLSSAPNVFTGNVASATGSTVYDNMATYNGAKAVDGSSSTRWATPDGTITATLDVTMTAAKAFNTAVIEEYLLPSETTRISKFNIEYWDDASLSWKIAFTGVAGGAQKVFTFPEVTATKVRLNILSCMNVTIWEFGLYNVEAPKDEVAIGATSMTLKPGEVSQLNISGRLADGTVVVGDIIDSITYYADSNLVTISDSGLLTMGGFTEEGTKINVYAVVSINGVEYTTAPIIITGSFKLVNLALNKAATASSTYSSAYSAANAVDKNMRTRWASLPQQSQYWLEVNFGKNEQFNMVKMNVYSDKGDPANYIVYKSFKIQYYKDGQWIDAFDSATGTCDIVHPVYNGSESYNNVWIDSSGKVKSTDYTIKFDAVSSDRIRIYSNDTAKDPSIIEFEVYNSVAFVDKTALIQAIALADGYNESEYTAESWAILAAAVEEGRQILLNSDATDAMVSAAVVAISEAMTKLVPIVVARSEVYISLNGDDANDGTLSAPFKTFDRALQYLKAHKNDGIDITVFVRGGKYYLNKSLDFTAEVWNSNNGVTFRPYGNEDVTISGAADLGVLEWAPYAGRNGVYVANIGSGYTFDSISINGEKQILARYPNYVKDENLKSTISVSNAQLAEKVATWANPAGGFIRALHSNEWGGNDFIITGKSGTNLQYTWVGDNNRGSGINSTHRLFENIFEELDTQNEWFYNKAEGKLYYYPSAGVDLSTAKVEVSSLEQLIKFVGSKSLKDGKTISDEFAYEYNPVKNIVFDGIDFADTHRTLFTSTFERPLRGDWGIVRKGAIYMENSENITIKNGSFLNMGGNAIMMSAYNKGNVVDYNDFISVGASAVLIVGLEDSVRNPSHWDNNDHRTTMGDFTVGPRDDNYSRDITISNNYMYDIGVFEKQTSGVCMSIAARINVLRNTIHRTARAGINISDGTFGGHVIAYNDLFDTVRETGDHGPINTWGRDRFWSLGGFDTMGNRGDIKRPYATHDAIETTLIHNNRVRATGTFGIDLDDGSSNYKVYNNLCLGGSIKVREGFLREVYNNVIIGAPIDQHCTYTQSDDKMYDNIVFNGTGISIAGGESSGSTTTYDRMFYYNGNFAISNARGNVNTSKLNPNFVLPSANNYAVANGSPVLSLTQFKNFPMADSDFGRPDKPKAPAFIYLPGGEVTSSEVKFMDFGADYASSTYISNIMDEAMRSAAGLPDYDGVMLVNIAAGGYFASEGFRQSDVIRSINGVIIKDIDDLYKAFYDNVPGAKLDVVVYRNQSPMDLTITRKSGPTIYSWCYSGSVQGTGWDIAGGRTNDNTYSGKANVSATNKAGDYFEFKFYGTGIDFLSEKYSDEGNYQVYIDGIDMGIASGYSTQRERGVVYSAKGLELGYHTLKMVNLENKYMILDGFRVYDEVFDINNFTATATNGELNLVFSKALTAAVSDFAVTYSIDNGAAKQLDLTGITVDGKNVSLSFVPFEKPGLDKKVTFSIKYKDQDAVSVVLTLEGDATYTLYNDTFADLVYQGNWIYSANRNPSNGLYDHNKDVHATNSAGASVSYTFRGTGVIIYVSKDTAVNAENIYLDGVLVADKIPCYTSQYTGFVPLYTVDNLEMGVHTIKLEHASGGYMNFDAIAILNQKPLINVEITSVLVEPTTIVEGLAANLKVKVAGEELEGKTISVCLKANGQELGKTTVDANGEALIKIAKAPAAGEYEIVAVVDGTEVSKSVKYTVAQNSASIWDIAVDSDEDGYAYIHFNEDVTLKSTSKVTVNGVKVTATQIDARTIRIDAKDLKQGDAVRVEGVKFVRLYPGYSFAFNTTI